jgi:nicotinate-nucleotide adenylyltransferase
MRIGLFGGTFNPVHTGHLRTVLEVKEQFNLDRIFLIPSSIPPHKPEAGIAVSSDRLAMVCAAVKNLPHFEVSDVEIQRTGPSYTIDTLNHFASEFSITDQCFLIVGLDAFLEMHTWKSYLDIFRKVPLIVMGRPQIGISIQQKTLHDIVSDYLFRNIVSGFTYERPSLSFSHPELPSVYLMTVTAMDISSSHIRSLISRGRSIRYLVPDVVMEYILHKGLYQ